MDTHITNLNRIALRALDVSCSWFCLVVSGVGVVIGVRQVIGDSSCAKVAVTQYAIGQSAINFEPDKFGMKLLTAPVDTLNVRNAWRECLSQVRVKTARCIEAVPVTNNREAGRQRSRR